MNKTMNWAIIDAAAEPELFSMLELYDPPNASLYSQPIPEEIGRLAPYLVQMNDNCRQWLMQRATPWGIWLESKAEMKLLRQHLRKYLHVQIPDEEKPVFFRFYDPRNIWPLLSVLSPWEKHSFLGPVEAIATHWKRELRDERFTALREQYPLGSGSRRKMMRISHEQLDALTLVFEQQYVDGLVEKIETWSKDGEKIETKTVGETFRWLKQQGIIDDRSIRGLFYLFCQRRCLSVDKMPAPFLNALCNEAEEGTFKAETLLIQELGDVPL
jgi:Fe2+ or Zn2+ uptake regulation protein